MSSSLPKAEEGKAVLGRCSGVCNKEDKGCSRSVQYYQQFKKKGEIVLIISEDVWLWGSAKKFRQFLYILLVIWGIDTAGKIGGTNINMIYSSVWVILMKWPKKEWMTRSSLMKMTSIKSQPQMENSSHIETVWRNTRSRWKRSLSSFDQLQVFCLFNHAELTPSYVTYKGLSIYYTITCLGMCCGHEDGIWRHIWMIPKTSGSEVLVWAISRRRMQNI